MKRLRAEALDDDDDEEDVVLPSRKKAERAAQSQPITPPPVPPAETRRPRSLWNEALSHSAPELVEMRRSLGVLVRGDDVHLCPRPVSTADDPALPPFFADAMRALGPPSAVQAQAWPALLAGLDVLCLAETGSGKTLAYLLPLMARAHAAGRGKPATAAGGDVPPQRTATVQSLAQQPVVLVLAPTRELATQIALVARKLRKASGLRAVAVYGGVPRQEQLAVLATGCDLLVGTPGRVLDLITDGTGRPSKADAAAAARPADGESAKAAKRRKKAAREAQADAEARAPADVDLGALLALVIDEADKMLAQGFHEQIDSIVQRIAEQARAHRGGGGGGGNGADGGGGAVGGAFGPGKRRALRTALLVGLFSSTMPGRLTEAARGWTNRALFVRANRKVGVAAPLPPDGAEGEGAAEGAHGNGGAADMGADARARGAGAAPESAGGGAASGPPAGEAARGSDGARGCEPPDSRPDLATRVSASVAQTVQVTAEHKKPRKLLAFLRKVAEADAAAGARNKSRVLIFTNKARHALGIRPPCCPPFAESLAPPPTPRLQATGSFFYDPIATRRGPSLSFGAAAARQAGQSAHGRRPSRPRAQVSSTESVCALLRRAGHKCGALHGERRQKEREAALADFRCGKVALLVATDVAGRGLDVPKLPHVVNYDFPPNLEAYVNRVGRVGRAGAQGSALSFFTRNLAKLAPDVVRLLEAAEQPVESYLRQLAVAVEAGRDGEAVLRAAEAAEP